MIIKGSLLTAAAVLAISASPADGQAPPPSTTGPQSTQPPPAAGYPAAQADQSVVPTDIDTGIGDIVVTATRTGETRAQAAPLAITVLGADRLIQDYIDIARIEVPCGPQGTLYGRNAVGGPSTSSRACRPMSSLKAQLTVGYFNRITKS